MKPIKTVIVLFAFLAVLNLGLTDFSIKGNTVLAVSTVQDSIGTVAATGLDDTSTDKVNVTLWIKDWEEKTAFGKLNVTIYDLRSKQASSYPSNKTGHVDLEFLDTGSYVVSVQKDNRTVGYQKIDVVRNGTFVIRTWSYDLNLTLIDRYGSPLANHTVSLYDQTVFRAPNYTIVTDNVLRKENYTVLTEQAGRLINQTKTDVNGTIRFVGLWNGTYRIGFVSNESWITDYVLGKPVTRRLEPTNGEFVLELQEPTSLQLRFLKMDLALKFISESNNPLRNATIYIRDELGHLFFKDRTNETGFIENKNIYVSEGVYDVSARYGNRTLGHRDVNAENLEALSIKTWTYDLNVTLVDQEDNPLPNHVIFLYDQLVFYSPTNFTLIAANQTGLLVNWTKTDENGRVFFRDVWNGTYKIRAVSGEPIGEKITSIQRPDSIILKSNKTYVVLRLVSGFEEPLSNATVYIYNSAGRLVFRDYTGQSGTISHEDIYLGSYNVFVEWMGTEVWSGTLDLRKNKEFTIRCSVFRLTLQFTDPLGNALPKADITLRKRITAGRYIGPTLKLETNENGYISSLLPYGTYEVLYSYGIYSGWTTVNLASNYSETVRGNILIQIWFLALFVASPLVILALLLERKRLRTPLEIRRYKNMLSRLESMYKSGLVEYKLYRKLREEYEAKLMELGGREVR